MESFYNLKYKVYPHEKFNTSKGVFRNKEFSMFMPEKIDAALGKHGVTVYRRIGIKKGGQQILSHLNI